VTKDEENVKRKGAAAGSRFLGCPEEGRGRKFGKILPQVKQLKRRKLKLPVGGKKNGRQGKRHVLAAFDPCLPFHAMRTQEDACP